MLPVVKLDLARGGYECMPVLGHPGFHSFYIADDRRKEKNPGCLSRHTILHGDQLDDFDIWMKENIANFHTIIRDCVLRKIILFSLNLLHQLPYLRRHRDLLYYNSSSPQNDTGVVSHRNLHAG